MTYRRALECLESRKETRIRLGLGRIRRHLWSLGDPQESFQSIHVAGTNGKGSVCAFLDSILREAGYKVGLYLSPHLEDVRERIRIDGRWIGQRDFARLMARTLHHELRDRLTYFELLTSIAFQYFSEKKVDLAVLETGLGGEFDATNVVRKPLAALIPSIDFDHMNFLGKTLTSIARAKAGIIKSGSPAFTAETKPAALRVLRMRARQVATRLHILSRSDKNAWKIEKINWNKGLQIFRGPRGRLLKLGIMGEAQASNAALVCEAIGSLRDSGYKIAPAAVARGLARARWPGRFEVAARGKRTLLLDGAHNPHAMRHFVQTLKNSPWRDTPKVFIVGFLRDKDHRAMVRILAPWVTRMIATQPPNPRALRAAFLGREMKKFAPGAEVSAIVDPRQALTMARLDQRCPVICVCGSFYLVGLARRMFKAWNVKLSDD